MNSLDEQLECLLRAARRAAGPESAPLSFGLQTQAMATWRESLRLRGFWEGEVLARGMIAAVVLTALSLLPSLSTSHSLFSDVLQLTNATLNSDATP